MDAGVHLRLADFGGEGFSYRRQLAGGRGLAAGWA